MPDYENGKIYKLWSPQGEQIYIGSTTQSLAVRKAKHKSSQDCCSKILFQKYDDVRIELIEEYPCKNKMELNKREGEIMRNNDCINRCIAGRTKKEYNKYYRENNKEKVLENKKEYRENNREKMRQKGKEYRENNKEKLLEYYKKYYENNKEKKREKRKEYYEKNKEQILEYLREYREKNKNKI